MPDKLNRITSEAVHKATGKTWDEWIAFLDKLGAKEMEHKEVARMLYDDKYIKTGWWAQMVTVGYEYAHGRRVTGETEGAGFEIGVQKTFPISSAKAWELVTSAEGVKIWLGEDANFKVSRGATYKTADGVTGEVRSFEKAKRLRFTWQSPKLKEPATVQILFIPTGENTSIRFHQEKLSRVEEREAMRRHWQQVLEKLSRLM